MLIKKDYFYVAIIGACFALFSFAIIPNIIPSVQIGLLFKFLIVVIVTLLAIIALWIAGKIAKKLPITLQLAKFAAVGAFNTFLDWGVLNALISLTAIAGGATYSLFKGASFIIANIGSYFWNRAWTFETSGKATGQEYGKFFVVSLVGLVINIGLASIIVNLIGPQGGLNEAQWANVGALVATLASLIWNFVGYKFFVFITKNKAQNQQPLI